MICYFLKQSININFEGHTFAKGMAFKIYLAFGRVAEVGRAFKQRSTKGYESHHALEKLSKKANNLTPYTILYEPMND